MIAYLLVTISAPAFLYKLGSLKGHHIVSSALTGTLLMIPIISSLYPQPTGPAKYFPYIFGGWLILSLVFHEIRDRRLTTIQQTDEN
ncbi:hypothetical protein ACFQ22_02795 [Lentilactobacillus raoultii]|uniref:Uncharacterized protein n=1 Tax=Lentilactobacillus raoultii TaxID=1987503 RepID=A0ABW3PE17_9LACO|nr:hypothetical protein [Lentilactobacillus raoultii]